MGTMRDLVLSDTAIGLVTNNYYRDNLFIGDDDSRAKWILTARWIESLVLTTLAVGTGAYVMRAMARVIRPSFLLGVPAGMGVAYCAHRFRTNLLLNKKITPNVPYTTSLSIFYHDTFSILKGKWQVLEATTAAAVALSVFGMTLRLSRIYPVAVASLAALTAGTTAAYLATDYILGRFRQI